MAINLNTLTSPATSGDVLAEALTTADFLEGVPVLRNLARGSQKGGNAKQGTALNQPKALPLDANGKGYLYLSGVSGNYASVPDATNLDGFGDFTFQVDNLYLPDWSPSAQVTPIAKGSSWQFSVHTSGSLRLDLSGVSSAFSDPTGLTDKTTASIRAVRAGSVLTFFYSLNGGETWVSVPYNYGGGSGTLTNDPLPLAIGAANVSSTVLGKVSGAKVWNNATQSGTPVLDVDFTATKIRHNDTKFVCDSGQVVTINKSGNDPATIIKKPVLRFDGVNDFMQGLLNQTITGSSIFIAYSVLGDGGVSGRLLGLNSTGANDNDAGGYFLARDGSTTNVIQRYNGGSNIVIHAAMYDDALGDVLLEADIKNGSQISKLNNANQANGTTTVSGDLSSEEFKIASFTPGSNNGAIDLEYLALFPATITDAQADDVRNYINNRNNVFDLKDGFGYYFFESSATSNGQVFSSGGYPWNGRIVGSDNGDTNRYLYQDTLNDRPTSDGYKITFADNTDHFNIASTTQAGWQVVGTSLGTFAYRVNNTAVTELNLLGNLGSASRRKAGQSYGMILLPESATGADIEDARKLLIDRGASDAANTTTFENYWRDRGDIVEFQFIDTSTVTDFSFAWFNTRLTSFPFIDTSNGTNFFYAFYDTRLASFPALDMSKGTNFSNAWNSVSTLSSFPAGAKLGTSATNVNFTSAWNSSGLTSFPALDLSTGNNFANSFISSDLTSFPDGIKMGTAATGDVQFTDTWRDTTLSSFPALDLGNGKFFNGAFRDCHELTSFPSDIKLGTNKTGVGFTDAWRGSGLTSFPALDLSAGTNFNQAFYQATSLQEFGQCDFSNGSSFDLCWYYCSALTSFPSMQLPSATSLNSTWMGCSSLTNFGKLEAPNVTVFRFTWSGSGITTIEDGTLLGTSASSVDFTSAFKNCIALTTLPSNLNLSKGDDFQTAFQNCQSLVNFPANAFDTMGTPQDYCFLNTWLDNNALSAASVENILVSINTSGQSAPSTGPEITIKYNTATGTPAYSTLASLKGKGWVVIVNGVTL